MRNGLVAVPWPPVGGTGKSHSLSAATVVLQSKELEEDVDVEIQHAGEKDAGEEILAGQEKDVKRRGRSRRAACSPWVRSVRDSVLGGLAQNSHGSV